MDIHDIARSSRTYGVRRFFVAHPVPGLRALSERIVEHWSEGTGARHNPSRKEALQVAQVATDLDQVLTAIEQETGQLPRLVATSARRGPNLTSFRDLAAELDRPGPPVLVVLGTGHGLAESVLRRCETRLEPVKGRDDYNHLSVRAAAAIILDRLRGERSPC